MTDPEMSEAPAEVAAEGPADQENPMQMAQEAGDYLSKVAQVVDKMGSPSMKEKMAQIMELYSSLVDEAMGSMGGSEPEGQGQVPMDQGMGGKPMGPQTRQ